MPILANVTEHRHCEICQGAIPLEDRLCGSEACLKKFNEALKAKKRAMYMLVGIILVAMLFGALGSRF